MKIINDEYILGFVDGNFGDGKTAFLANLAYEYQDDYTNIYSNFKIKVPNNVFLPEITKDVILALNEDYQIGQKRSMLLLQESYNYFDKRWCMKKANKEIATALFQIRKLGIDIMSDIPRIQYLDFRSQEFGNMFFNALGRIAINEVKTNIFVYRQLFPYGVEADITYTNDYTEFFNKKIYETMEKTI